MGIRCLANREIGVPGRADLFWEERDHEEAASPDFWFGIFHSPFPQSS